MNRKNDPNATKLRFHPTSNADFFSTLRQKVDNYFKENQISKYGDYRFFIKTVVMLSLYIVPFVLILTGVFSIWAMLIFTFIIGIGKAGIGMCVMHDANHGSSSPSKTVNKIFGNTMYLLGASNFAWKIQHNVLHHTYTNVYDMDEDIDNKFIIRLSPYADLKKFHKYQYIYALPLYCFLTIAVLVKDYSQVLSYTSKNFQFKANTTQAKELLILSITKLLYLTCALLLPYLLLDITWWQLLIGFCVTHFTTGFILSIVFQLAHVLENTEHHHIPEDNDHLENTWAVHQLRTTADFAHNNKLLSWYIGGLNFQIEHHLFPHICHVHYPAISKIVKSTAKEFNLPYNESPTFLSAVISHIKMLKELGSTKIQPATA